MLRDERGDGPTVSALNPLIYIETSGYELSRPYYLSTTFFYTTKCETWLTGIDS